MTMLMWGVSAYSLFTTGEDEDQDVAEGKEWIFCPLFRRIVKKSVARQDLSPAFFWYFAISAEKSPVVLKLSQNCYNLFEWMEKNWVIIVEFCMLLTSWFSRNMVFMQCMPSILCILPSHLRLTTSAYVAKVCFCPFGIFAGTVCKRYSKCWSS